MESGNYCSLVIIPRNAGTKVSRGRVKTPSAPGNLAQGLRSVTVWPFAL